MKKRKHPWMVIIAGPNGAGKSTFYDLVIKDDPLMKNAPFINMDNIALSEAERAESRKNAEKKTRQVAEKEADIELYMNQRNTEMRKIVQAKREGIIADIKKEIQRRATAEGYDFVLDSSSKTLSEQPAVLLFPELDDLTSQVITELNRSRTVPAPASARRETPPATDLLK